MCFRITLLFITYHSYQGMKAPYLILCSENDDLAPYQVICNFAERLRELGADVKLVKWNGSPHVGVLQNLNSELMIINAMLYNFLTTNDNKFTVRFQALFFLFIFFLFYSFGQNTREQFLAGLFNLLLYQEEN